jgi:hypothetical protein
MRKCLVFLLSLLVVGSAYASTRTFIDNVTLTNESLSTVKVVNIENLKNPTFGIVFTKVAAAGLSGNITVTLNNTFDGSTWQTQSFYDVNNITTVAPMTTKTLTSNQTYLIYIPKDRLGYTVPIVAMNITSNAGSLINTSNVNVYLSGETL